MPVQQIQTSAMKDFLKEQKQLDAPQSAMQSRIQPSIPLQDMTVEEVKKPKKFTDIFEKVTNPPDMNDTVKVPRTIFKGYLSFTVGTSLLTLSSLAQKFKPLSMALRVFGILSTIYGTYSFVKPYALKERKAVDSTKNN